MRTLRTLLAAAAASLATVAMAVPASAHAGPDPSNSASAHTGPDPSNSASAHAGPDPSNSASAHAGPDPSNPASYDFSDCPALPPDVEPATWRCEVHLAMGEITIGRTRISGIPMRLVHAEGPLADGSTGQVFSTLRSRPAVVSHGRQLTVQVRYAGYADLVGNGPDPGGLYLMLAVRGPGLGAHCTIGSPADPIKTHATRVGDTTTIPTVPPIKQFTLQDTAFTVPSASGCGGSGDRVDTRFGLPSTAGNTLTLQAAYTYRMY